MDIQTSKLEVRSKTLKVQYNLFKTATQKRQNIDLNDKSGSLMKVESIAECSKGSILQYFRPAFSDNWFSKPIFGLFESGRFT